MEDLEMVVTTGAIRCAKLQSNRHHQQTNTQLFTGQMPFLFPNQQCHSTEGNAVNMLSLHWKDFCLNYMAYTIAIQVIVCSQLISKKCCAWSSTICAWLTAVQCCVPLASSGTCARYNRMRIMTRWTSKFQSAETETTMIGLCFANYLCQGGNVFIGVALFAS